MVCTASGPSGALMCSGQLWLPNLTAGSAVGQVGYPNFFPVTAPATGAVDTTATKLLETTVQWSVSNAANTVQATQYHLESLI